jgi:hypothetical protein
MRCQFRPAFKFAGNSQARTLQREIDAILAAAQPHKRASENLSAGLMKAIKTSDGRVEFCAFVLTGQKSIFGDMNRYFFAGQFPSTTSTAVSMGRSSSEVQGMALIQDCRKKGMEMD